MFSFDGDGATAIGGKVVVGGAPPAAPIDEIIISGTNDVSRVSIIKIENARFMLSPAKIIAVRMRGCEP